ncbi:hypothetical protein HJC23_008603 [Cyclotella cryptica]|uniref:OsmC family protein n=1 Tax=Cyclotella cryptica TaxID=29204 RepID=A0ABD3Q781_9STRA
MTLQLMTMFVTSAALISPVTTGSLRHAWLHHRRSVLTQLLRKNLAMISDNDNENYIKSYRIHGTGMRSAVEMKTSTGHNIYTDVPIKMGGRDEAPQPVEHLLAALIGCTQATAVYVGRMMKPRLIIERIEFDLEGFRDERGALELPIEQVPSIPARLELITGVVKMHFKKGITPSAEQLMTLKEQTEARCPVASMMLASGCKMDISWIDQTVT